MVAIAINETARLLASLELQDKFTGPARTIGSSVDGLERRVGGLQSTFGRVQQGLGQMGRGVGQIGSGIDRIATRAVIAAAGIGTALVTTAASFETARAGIRKTVGGTVQEVDALIEGVENLSRTVPLSFEELAAITAEGGALGIANENLVAFTDVVARLGVSTDLSVDQAATALGHMANVLQLDDSDLRDFSDSLVALGNNGASTESEILDLATRFGAAGHQAGLTSEAILALASTTSSMGIEAEAGGGALSRIFQGITLDIGTATEEGQILAESMGLSLAELRTAWDNDAGAVFGELLQVLSELDQFEKAQFLSNLGITNVRDINALSTLSTGVQQYTEDLKTSTGQTNELNKESDAFFNTTAGKWQTFQNNVRLAADVVGGELLPVVNEVLGDLVERLSDPKVQQGLKDFGTNLATGVRDFIDEVKRFDFGPLIGTLQGAASIAKGAFDAFRSLPQPIQQLALAAIVANKVTGGAVGSIASGLGNILAGGLKIAFLDRGTVTNPMWVRQIGLPSTGPTGPGAPGGGGFGRLLFGLTGVGLAAMLADEFEEEIATFAEDTRNSLFGEGNALIELPSGPSEWQWPFGSANPPDWLPGFLGGPEPDVAAEVALAAGARPTPSKPTVAGGGYDPNVNQRDSRPDPRKVEPFGIGALQDMIDRIKAATTLPDTAMTLPDTAMAPVTDAVHEVRDAIESENRFGVKELRGMIARIELLTKPYVGRSDNQGTVESTLDSGVLHRLPTHFVPTVKLDTSTVRDLRGTEKSPVEVIGDLFSEHVGGKLVSLIHETKNWGQAGVAYDAISAARLASFNQTLSEIEAEVASQGGRQLAKQEAIAAAVRVNTSVLASKNYAPKFNLTALVTNNVSISDIQRRITSQSVALGLPTRPEPI